MRLLDILHKSSELWRLGLGFIVRKLGLYSKSRRLEEQRQVINELREKLLAADKELFEVRSQRDEFKDNVEGLKQEFTREQLEAKLKLASDSIEDIKGKLEFALETHYKKPVLTISEKDKLIASLRDEIASINAKYDAAMRALDDERREHAKQKNATSQMWKFIHTRHRLNVKPQDGSIRKVLMR